MKEQKQIQSNETEVIVKNQGETMPEQSEPNQKQIIDGLAQQLIAFDKQNKELQTENHELKRININLNNEINSVVEENKALKKELASLSEPKKECSCCCEPNPYKGFNTPWEVKMNEMYSNLEGEEKYYETQIRELKHRKIEFPDKPANDMNLKFCKQHLKKIRRIKKAILK